MNIQELYTLLKKYRERRCTIEESDKLNCWFEQFQEEADRIPGIPEEKLERLFSQIGSKILFSQSVRQMQKRLFRRLAGLAAMLAVCTTAGYYLFKAPSETVLPEKQEAVLIQPGRLQARLILSDGSTVLLDSSTVVKDLPGQLIKTAATPVLDYSATTSGVTEEAFNVITVPQGGEYKLILADGTQVWLNSGSSLKYPVAFVKDSRQVDLNGEAYFEVTKDSRPFIVRTFDMDIKVLGTSFNISAYGNDDCIRTTLVEGKVIVANKHDECEYTMAPGHAWTYTRSTDKTEMTECDTELYTSWIKGIFKFRDMPLEEIMQKLNRWYGCSVRFENERLKQLRFSGTAKKDRPIGYLLEMIQSITKVDFEIEGTSVVVKSR